MAFSSLSSALYDVGKAVTRQLFSTLKSNQDDLQTRLLSLEGSANKIEIFNGVIYGIGGYSTITGSIFHRAKSDITLTDAKVIVFDISGLSSGTISLDVQKATSADFTSSVSVFTTEPSLDLSTAASYDESTNAAFDATNKVVSAGDWLRIDITSIPAGLGKAGFYLIGEPT